MNKKASTQAIINADFLIALIAFIAFIVWASGGGLGFIYDIGKFMAKIPIYVWLLLAGFYLFIKITS